MKRANGFCEGFLELPICARTDTMTFFSFGSHHDFAIAELRAAKSKLEGVGIEVNAIDHKVTKSLYLSDPNGHGVELYIDASDYWKLESERVAYVERMDI